MVGKHRFRFVRWSDGTATWCCRECLAPRRGESATLRRLPWAEARCDAARPTLRMKAALALERALVAIGSRAGFDCLGD